MSKAAKGCGGGAKSCGTAAKGGAATKSIGGITSKTLTAGKATVTAGKAVAVATGTEKAAAHSAGVAFLKTADDAALARLLPGVLDEYPELAGAVGRPQMIADLLARRPALASTVGERLLFNEPQLFAQIAKAKFTPWSSNRVTHDAIAVNAAAKEEIAMLRSAFANVDVSPAQVRAKVAELQATAPQEVQLTVSGQDLFVELRVVSSTVTYSARIDIVGTGAVGAAIKVTYEVIDQVDAAETQEVIIRPVERWPGFGGGATSGG